MDLESDFSAIHRVSDMYSLPGPRFFAFATRMDAYKGVIRARVEAEEYQKQKKEGVTVGDETRYEVESTGPAFNSAFGEFMEHSEV